MRGTFEQGVLTTPFGGFQPAWEQRATMPRKKGAGKASYALLLLFLALLYTSPGLILPGLEAYRPTLLVASAAMLMVFYDAMASGRGFPTVKPESQLLLAFLIAAGLSCLTALWMSYAVDAMTNLAKMATGFFVIVAAVDTEKRLRGALWVMTLSAAVPALGALRFYLGGIQNIEGRAGWLGFWRNPNDLAYSMVVLIPLAIFLMTKARFFSRVILAGLLIIFLLTIYFTFSRGGLAGLLAVLLVLGVRYRGFLMRITAAFVLGALLAAAMTYWSRPVRLGQLGSDPTVEQRVATIRAGLSMFSDYPVLGVGIGCSIVAWPLYAPAGELYRGALVNHNTFVQALSETGILGFPLFILLVVAGIYHARKIASREHNRTEARLGAALEAALLGFVVCGLSGGYLLTWFPYLVLGLIGAATRIVNQGDQEMETAAL